MNYDVTLGGGVKEKRLEKEKKTSKEIHHFLKNGWSFHLNKNHFLFIFYHF